MCRQEKHGVLACGGTLKKGKEYPPALASLSPLVLTLFRTFVASLSFDRNSSNRSSQGGMDINELAVEGGTKGENISNARSAPFLGTFSWGQQNTSFGWFGSFRAVSYEQNNRVVEGTTGRKRSIANDVRTALDGGIVGGGTMTAEDIGGGEEDQFGKPVRKHGSASIGSDYSADNNDENVPSLGNKRYFEEKSFGVETTGTFLSDSGDESEGEDEDENKDDSESSPVKIMMEEGGL